MKLYIDKDKPIIEICGYHFSGYYYDGATLSPKHDAPHLWIENEATGESMSFPEAKFKEFMDEFWRKEF